MRTLYLALIVLLGLCHSSFGHTLATDFQASRADSFPVPKNVKNLLFYVQRDPNANTVVYQLGKAAEGRLKEEEPVRPFWIRYADQGERRELNYIQRKFAYGLNTRKLGHDSYELKFVSYGKLPLYLRKGTDGQYHVYAAINKKQAILDRVFVRIEGGTFWVPNVLYIELKGRDAVSGKEVVERFKP